MREGSERDIKETAPQESGIPRIFINLKIETKIKRIILGPKIGNGYDKVPYIYLKLNKKIPIVQSEIEYV